MKKYSGCLRKQTEADIDIDFDVVVVVMVVAGVAVVVVVVVVRMADGGDGDKIDAGAAGAAADNNRRIAADVDLNKRGNMGHCPEGYLAVDDEIHPQYPPPF